MVDIKQKKVRIDSVPKDSIITTGQGDTRAIVLHTGEMGTRVDVTANYAKWRIDHRGNKVPVTDGLTLGPQIWSAETTVYIVEE